MESRKTMTDYRIQGATGEWEVVIGLEVHAQVTSNAKLFSGASTAFGAEPNSQVSLDELAMDAAAVEEREREQAVDDGRRPRRPRGVAAVQVRHPSEV